jgi:uncharacterized protein YjbK
VTQTNHYFDTPDRRFLAARVMLRIRESTTALLTLKCGREVRPGLFDSLELESVLEPGELEAILAAPGRIQGLRVPAIDELKRRFGALDIVRVGVLRNVRTRLQGPRGLVFELDRLAFPDESEGYELEVEIAAPAPGDETEPGREVEEIVRRELALLGVQAAPERKTKLERLVALVDPTSQRPSDAPSS